MNLAEGKHNSVCNLSRKQNTLNQLLFSKSGPDWKKLFPRSFKLCFVCLLFGAPAVYKAPCIGQEKEVMHNPCCLGIHLDKWCFCCFCKSLNHRKTRKGGQGFRGTLCWKKPGCKACIPKPQSPGTCKGHERSRQHHLRKLRDTYTLSQIIQWILSCLASTTVTMLTMDTALYHLILTATLRNITIIHFIEKPRTMPKVAQYIGDRTQIPQSRQQISKPWVQNTLFEAFCLNAQAKTPEHSVLPGTILDYACISVQLLRVLPFVLTSVQTINYLVILYQCH